MESRSFLLRSRCFLTATAFLIRKYISSGREGARPTLHSLDPPSTVLLQDSENLGASHSLHLTNTLLISQQHANLRGGKTLLRQTAHGSLHLSRRSLQPGRSGSLVGQARSRNTLSTRSQTLPPSAYPFPYIRPIVYMIRLRNNGVQPEYKRGRFSVIGWICIYFKYKLKDDGKTGSAVSFWFSLNRVVNHDSTCHLIRIRNRKNSIVYLRE